MMSREQASISELLLSLDSAELEEAEKVRVAVNQQLSSDRGGAVLSGLVDYYLESSSSQAVLLLSSIREPHHKALLEKLNEVLGRSSSRLGGLTLLGHLVRKQPPWMHHVSHSALLHTLLRCLKTDSDAVVLISGVLVLITLLPMIPHAGKHHVYDFFDVFGRLASWSLTNLGHAPPEQLVHLHASVYSLFHRLYGMYPCNFISYLRLHYSMKENLDTFHELVKPMLDHVRVHPELVTGTQDQELEPSRWRCFEVHDIVIECSRVSLDPLDSSWEDNGYSSSASSARPLPAPHPDTTSCPQADTSGTGIAKTLSVHSSHVQAADVPWSPSYQCGLSTPPPEPLPPGFTPSLVRASSTSGVRCSPSASVPKTTATTECKTNNQQPPPVLNSSGFQPPVMVQQCSGGEEAQKPCPLLPMVPMSNLGKGPVCLEAEGPAPPYERLLELALPRAAALFVGKKTQEVLERMGAEQRGEGGIGEEQLTPVSPLQVLDQLITHGDDVHKHLTQRVPMLSKSMDWSHCGGQQLSMKVKGQAQGEELQALRSQLLLVHSQLQYERFKRQQHAIRNRRLLRRVINAVALEEDSVAMRTQLGMQDVEIQALRNSLEEEQQRYAKLQQDTHTHSTQLNRLLQQALRQQQEQRSHSQRLQNELHECQSQQRNLEAELQRANNQAYNAGHRLTQASVKLSLSELVQQQVFLLNQQLLLLREANRALRRQLQGEDTHHRTEVSMLQSTVGREQQRLRESELQHRQKLEAANHKISELENLLARKDQLILDQKKLLEDTKSQSRAELCACEERCASLRSITHTLQAEMLQQQHLMQPTDHSSSNSVVTMPTLGSSLGNKPLPSSLAMLNGGVVTLCSSPLLLPSSSPSPPPLAVGSFLEQRAHLLFGPLQHQDMGAEEEEGQLGSPTIGQEADEHALFRGSPDTLEYQQMEPASGPLASPPVPPRRLGLGSTGSRGSLTQAVRQRRHELSIMDYDKMLPEF